MLFNPKAGFSAIVRATMVSAGYTGGDRAGYVAGGPSSGDRVSKDAVNDCAPQAKSIRTTAVRTDEAAQRHIEILRTRPEIEALRTELRDRFGPLPPISSFSYSFPTSILRSSGHMCWFSTRAALQKLFSWADLNWFVCPCGWDTCRSLVRPFG